MHTLTISIRHLDAAIVAREVATFRHSADIVPGFSIVKGVVEKRAEIRFFDTTMAETMEVYDFLALSWGLTCAWLNDGEGYEGCILKHPKR